MTRKSTATLTKLLEKRGIDSIKDLQPEEQETFNRYKLVLSGTGITIDSLKEFCQSQIRLIESKCDGITGLTVMQQACIHVYINILKAIEAPDAERESLEKYLIQLINS